MLNRQHDFTWMFAQALVEGITLLTVDAVLVRYRGPVKKV